MSDIPVVRRVALPADVPSEHWVEDGVLYILVRDDYTAEQERAEVRRVRRLVRPRRRILLPVPLLPPGMRRVTSEHQSCATAVAAVGTAATLAAAVLLPAISSHDGEDDGWGAARPERPLVSAGRPQAPPSPPTRPRGGQSSDPAGPSAGQSIAAIHTTGGRAGRAQVEPPVAPPASVPAQVTAPVSTSASTAPAATSSAGGAPEPRPTGRPTVGRSAASAPENTASAGEPRTTASGQAPLSLPELPNVLSTALPSVRVPPLPQVDPPPLPLLDAPLPTCRLIQLEVGTITRLCT